MLAVHKYDSSLVPKMSMFYVLTEVLLIYLFQYMGKWYLYAQLLPCSWKGAAQFNDWVYTQHMDSHGQSFTIEETWRLVRSEF